MVSLPAKVRDAERRCPRERACLVHVWSTRHRTERFATVSSGTSFAQVACAILGKQARAQIPDKDEILQITFHLCPQSPAPPAEPRALKVRCSEGFLCVTPAERLLQGSAPLAALSVGSDVSVSGAGLTPQGGPVPQGIGS